MLGVAGSWSRRHLSGHGFKRPQNEEWNKQELSTAAQEHQDPGVVLALGVTGAAPWGHPPLPASWCQESPTSVLLCVTQSSGQMASSFQARDQLRRRVPSCKRCLALGGGTVLRAHRGECNSLCCHEVALRPAFPLAKN